MILIADSGSTKTEWCVAEGGRQVQRILTKGLNPYFQSEEAIGQEIHSALVPELLTTMFDAVYFYGAGCLPEKVPVVQRAIAGQLRADAVEVHSDILAAAHGLSGRRPGIVCILGTGSNSCYYDGEKVVDNVSPLGFILGDEGSGAALGKLLLGDLLKNQLPAGLKEKFLDQFGLTPAAIIERVYRQPFPNRFLAGLSPFLLQNQAVPELRELVSGAFRSFLRRNVMQYDYARYPIHFVGSVAYYYQDILAEAIHECNMRLGTVMQAPMPGLISYYQ
jgi:N-acetylglucosamine kinase-like BadF-type ATPase